ncbi:50S ribosomal protein L1, partial [Francisella tularensis subsp. holarctica]|nr:50S ribosomal protein L1 [Francisella tularensis subsp. holarctica]
MAIVSKRINEISAKFNAEKNYPVSEAFDLLREFSSVKFVESLDVSVAFGVDPRNSDQVVRGSSVLPNGTGKT